MTCPNCGSKLAHIGDAPSDWAPYVCAACSRGWWISELSPAARALWLGEQNGGWDVTNADGVAAVAADIEAERQVG